MLLRFLFLLFMKLFFGYYNMTDIIFAWLYIRSVDSYIQDVVYFQDYESCQKAVESSDRHRDDSVNLTPIKPIHKCVKIQVKT
jgi:hypothetical protein